MDFLWRGFAHAPRSGKCGRLPPAASPATGRTQHRRAVDRHPGIEPAAHAAPGPAPCSSSHPCAGMAAGAGLAHRGLALRGPLSHPCPGPAAGWQPRPGLGIRIPCVGKRPCGSELPHAQHVDHWRHHPLCGAGLLERRPHDPRGARGCSHSRPARGPGGSAHCAAQ